MFKIILIFFLFSTAILIAQEKSDVHKAAANATNPLAFVTKLQVQPTQLYF